MASFLCVRNQPTIDESRCVGASYGWLILSKPETETNNLYLFNPSSKSEIRLPSFHKSYITKAILSADPSMTNDYVIVVIYGFGSRINLLKMGGEGTSTASQGWCDLDEDYMVADAICISDLLFVLDYQFNVSVWKVSGVPKKLTDIEASLHGDAFGLWKSMSDLCSLRCYLVKSSSDLLLVCRTVGEYVHDGQPVSEVKLLDSPTGHPLICPYMTLGFEVFKLNRMKNEWEEFKNIGADRALFLGGNHSVSVSTKEFPQCEGNSIYFTDDYLERMDEDYLYGGHDLGIYSMEEKNVKEVCDFGPVLMKIEPPPFWVVPATGYYSAERYDECGDMLYFVTLDFMKAR